MLPHIERIHFRDEVRQAPKIVLFWFLILVLVGLVSIGILLEGILHAEELREEQGFRPGEATCGTLLYRTDRAYLAAPILKTDVEITVSGLISRAIVRQQFKNDSAEWAEGLYVFPLPENAAVDHLTMRIGERIIEGVIKERAEAKKTYERAKTEGKRASLIEQERPNIFTTSVANIGPGDEITIEIQYQQTLRYEHGVFRLRFPLVVGPRYIPGMPMREEGGEVGHGWSTDTDQVPDASRITPPVEHPRTGLLNPVNLKIDLAAGFPLARLESSYHRIHTEEQEGRHSITLDEGAVPSDRDFELVWQPAPDKAPTAAVFTEQNGEETFVLFMVMPPDLSSPGNRMPREVVFIIDTSGSMHGSSIEQAKAALNLALTRLSPDDTFNIIQFNSVTHVLFTGSVSANSAHSQQAARFVSGLTAQGGTEMLPALQRALDSREDDARLRQVVFLTDGAVGNEDELFRVIQQRLGDSRLFTVGIGSAPNSYFMRKAAEFGRGAYTYISSPTEVQTKMDRLFRKLEHPALTDIQIAWPGAVASESFPSRIPDLYLGEPVMITLKAATLSGHAIIHGRFGSAPWQTELLLNARERRTGLSMLWARAKIDSLMNERVTGADQDRIRRAVIDVAVKHHLVTRYTSLVAVDVTPARPADKDIKTHALKTNLPHGWDYTHVFGLPQTATNGPIRLVMGLLLLALACAAFGLRVRRHAT
ncbi:MAG: marine proteobacterial sortase target protein [Nitrospiraceae bacterium]